MTRFSRLFSRLRKEAGFPTAYRFYHGNGGRRVLQCTFANYLRIESGENLPRADRLPLLCSLLRLPLQGRELRSMAEAYVEAWTGSAETAHWLAEALRSTGGPEPLDPARQALQKVVRRSARPLDMKQYRAIVGDKAAYWCYRALSGAKRARTAPELAKLFGYPEAEARRGLETLRKVGFAAKSKGGEYRAKHSGEFILFPDPSTLSAEDVERPIRYNREMARKKGMTLMVRHCGTRVDLDRFEGYLQYFREAIRAAQAYAVDQSAERSALVLVEGRVYKVLDD